MRTVKASMVCGALATSIAGFLFTLGSFTTLAGVVMGNRAGTEALTAVWAQWLGAALLGFGLAWTTVDINQIALKCVVASVALVETAVLAGMLRLYGIYWPPFTALTAGVLGCGFGLIYAQTVPGRRKRLIEEMFGGRISKATFRKFLESDEPLNFSGDCREASVVICEIFNRQILADALPPKDYVALTNAFLRAGAEALVQAGGVLEECDGQRLRAVFGAPLTDPDHAAQACDGAHALGRRLETLCQECIQRWNVAPDYRVGINSGEMIAGAYGAQASAIFRLTGEPLEFCDRLCAANTFYGSRMLLGPRSFELASDTVEVRPIELIRRRSEDAVDYVQEIYELLAPKNALTPQEASRRDIFWQGVILFRKRCWDEATAHFQTALCDDTGCEDAPARFYLERIAHARSGAQAIDWEGRQLREGARR